MVRAGFLGQENGEAGRVGASKEESGVERGRGEAAVYMLDRDVGGECGGGEEEEEGKEDGERRCHFGCCL